jgi:predicted transcriptional regulator
MKTNTLNSIVASQMNNEDFINEYEQQQLLGEIAYLVKRLRKEKNLTQKQLAEMIGSTQPVIARLESGEDIKRIPSLTMLYKIAKVTNNHLHVSFV